MPTWVGNILQTYKIYREERVRIRNSEIDCRMRMYDNLQYQSIVRFERIVSGRSSPLTAPLCSALLRSAPLRSRSTVFFQVPLPLRSRSSGFRARSAPFSAPQFSNLPLPLRSHAKRAGKGQVIPLKTAAIGSAQNRRATIRLRIYTLIANIV